jgi:hypothetical protein
MGRARRARASALIAGVVPAAALALPPVTHAADGQASPEHPHNREVTWRDRGNNRYLSVKDGSTKNGATVTTNPTDHARQQHWWADYKSVSHMGGMDEYDMKNANSGKCLTRGRQVPHKVLWAAVQEPCQHADTWAELSFYNGHNKFEGYLLLNGPDGYVACADDLRGQTINSVYIRTAPSIVSQNHHNDQTQGCIWH